MLTDITHDPNQLLFQKCTFPSKGESQCERNVAKIYTNLACRLHLELPTNMKRPDVNKDLIDAKERAKYVNEVVTCHKIVSVVCLPSPFPGMNFCSMAFILRDPRAVSWGKTKLSW